MKKRGKKLLSWLITLVLVLGIVPWISLTAKATEGDAGSQSSDSSGGGSGGAPVQETITVTFVVENGSWNDGTTENKTKTIDKGGTLESGQIPLVGSKPAAGYKTDGYWYPDPSTGSHLNESTIYTYTYWAVSKADPAVGDFTFTAPQGPLTYDGQSHGATVTPKDGIAGMGNITVKYKKNGEDVEGEPTYAGTYDVYIKVAEGDNYNATTSDLHGDGWSFTINKATPTAADFEYIGNPSYAYIADPYYAYTGIAHNEPAVKSKEGIEGLGSITRIGYYTDEGCTGNPVSAINVGTYYVAIDVEGGDELQLCFKASRFRLEV